MNDETLPRHDGAAHCPRWILKLDGAALRRIVILGCLTFWVGLGTFAFGL